MNCKWHLLVALLVLIDVCRAESPENPCNAVMWSEPRVVMVGGSIEIFCRCNSSTVRSQDMSLKYWIWESAETQPVDDVTIKYKNENVEESFSLTWYCFNKRMRVATFRVKLVPLLKFVEMKCRFQANETELACDYLEAGDTMLMENKKYFLSVNRSPRVPCFKKDYTFHCAGIPMNRSKTKKYLVKLDFECEGYNQTKEIELDYKQVETPDWPTGRVHIYADNKINVFWPNSTESSQKLMWHIQYLANNSKISQIQEMEEMEGRPIYQFEMPSFAYQTYKLRISRRYIAWGSPRSSEVETAEFVSPATLPKRPPNVLPNGFYHEPKMKYLYVYWIHLGELELNGPNFTYHVVTDKGKTAMIVGNNSALFRDWDDTHPATVTIWSVNSKGRSRNSSELQVPILTNSLRNQPSHLTYHIDNHTVTWQAPFDQNELTGYTVSLWSSSSKTSQLDKIIQLKVIDASQLHFQFDEYVVRPYAAVAANYVNNTSGGMQWNSLGWIVHRDNENTFEVIMCIILVVIIVLLGPIYLLFRKLRPAPRIEVTVPNILLKATEQSMDSEVLGNPKFTETHPQKL